MFFGENWINAQFTFNSIYSIDVCFSNLSPYTISLTIVDEPAEALFGQNDLRDEAQEVKQFHALLERLQVLQFGVGALDQVVRADRLAHQCTELYGF